MINDGFEHLFGYHRGEVIGRRAEDLNIWAYPSDRVRMVELLQAGGRVHNLEYDLCTKSGAVRQCQLSAEVIAVEGTLRVPLCGESVPEGPRRQLLQAWRPYLIQRNIASTLGPNGEPAFWYSEAC